MTLIRETLREIIRFSKDDEEAFVRAVREAAEEIRTGENEGQKIRLETCKNRTAELEVLLCRIYEDNALGRLPDSRYEMLNRQYSEEQVKLESEIRTLEGVLGGYEDSKKSPGKFIALVKKYQDFEELTTPMLIEFVDKVLVHERDFKGRPDSPQTIEIYFNFIGQFSVHEEHKPTPEEIELEARKERIRQKRHEQYLRRKYLPLENEAREEGKDGRREGSAPRRGQGERRLLSAEAESSKKHTGERRTGAGRRNP